ncbi:MAG: ABC transporter substrate-binding protein [Elusimicrobiota bacterium]
MPERIISLGPAVTEWIYLLGCGDRLVANTSYCKRPAEAVDKEKIGSVVDADIEKIVSLKPDLVLAISLTNPRLIRKLGKLGLRVEVFKQPENFLQLLNDFQRLGRMLGKEAAARVIVNTVKNKLMEVKDKAADLSKPRVFFQIGADPLFTATGDTFVNDFLEYSGGVNIAKKAKSGLYSREEVLKANPEVIFIITMGITGEREKNVWGSYRTLNAAKNNRIHIVDAYEICSPTPTGLIKSIDKIFALLHPGYASELNE